MRVKFDEVAPTPHQLELADRLEQVLRAHARYERLLAPARGNGPSIEFRLHTRPPALSVWLVLYQDSFHVTANGAEVRIELVEPDRCEAWADEVVAVTSRLLLHPLRIRGRHPVFRWLAPEGSIYLRDGQSGSWNGTLCPGGGKESTFDDWYEPAAGS